MSSTQNTIGLIALITLPLLKTSAWASDPRPVLPTPAPPPAVDPNYNGYNEPELLERQHVWTLHVADRLLRANPPGSGDPDARKMALLAIDEVMHYPAVPADSPATEGFARTRYAFAASEIEEATPVTDGALIWKLYNHAFVVRTQNVTLAFDLVRGWWAWNGSVDFDELTRRIISECDILFISHEHGDHAETWVKDLFLEQGKPVVAPEGVFPHDNRLLRPERGIETRHEIGLRGGRAIETVVCPGYQGGTLNNVYIVYTHEGLSFAHTGDLHQGNTTPIPMFEWIDGIGKRWPVDVLLVNNWTPRLSRVVEGFNPGLVIPGHENELGHSIEKRKPHFLSYDRTAGNEHRTLVMTWGESFLYLR